MSLKLMYITNRVDIASIAEECGVDRIFVDMCKDILEKRLKSPATVNYAIMDITDEDKYGRYCLYVELDSQNSFGVLFRSKYRVVLQAVYTDGTYSALSEAALPVSFINTEEMIKKIAEYKEELFNLRMSQASGNLEKPSRIKELRKLVARMKTIMREREN